MQREVQSDAALCGWEQAPYSADKNSVYIYMARQSKSNRSRPSGLRLNKKETKLAAIACSALSRATAKWGQEAQTHVNKAASKRIQETPSTLATMRPRSWKRNNWTEPSRWTGDMNRAWKQVEISERCGIGLQFPRLVKWMLIESKIWDITWLKIKQRNPIKSMSKTISKTCVKESAGHKLVNRPCEWCDHLNIAERRRLNDYVKQRQWIPSVKKEVARENQAREVLA